MCTSPWFSFSSTRSTNQGASIPRICRYNSRSCILGLSHPEIVTHYKAGIPKLSSAREKEKSNAIRYSRKRKLRQHRALLRRPWLGPTGCSDPWIPVEWRFLGEASPCSPGSGLQGHYL